MEQININTFFIRLSTKQKEGIIMEERTKDFSLVKISTCQSGPDSGCCEFCPDSCDTYIWPDGVILTDDEVEYYERWLAVPLEQTNV